MSQLCTTVKASRFAGESHRRHKTQAENSVKLSGTVGFSLSSCKFYHKSIKITDLGSGYTTSWILDQVPEVFPCGFLHLTIFGVSILKVIFPLLDRMS